MNTIVKSVCLQRENNCLIYSIYSIYYYSSRIAEVRQRGGVKGAAGLLEHNEKNPPQNTPAKQLKHKEDRQISVRGAAVLRSKKRTPMFLTEDWAPGGLCCLVQVHVCVCLSAKLQKLQVKIICQRLTKAYEI